MTFFEKVYNTGIVPVVVLNNADDAVPLAKALLKGGIDFMEITFRTECAAESIALITKEVPEMTVGAGTVINVEQAALAVKNGAKFIVSPGLDDGVVIWAKGNNIISISIFSYRIKMRGNSTFARTIWTCKQKHHRFLSRHTFFHHLNQANMLSSYAYHN